jgi:hypothetical protein
VSLHSKQLRIYSLLVPGILESRTSQETARVLGNSYTHWTRPFTPHFRPSDRGKFLVETVIFAW